MGMARSPAERTQSTAVQKDNVVKEAIVHALGQGMGPPEIAKVLGKDRRSQKVWRRRIWAMLEGEELDPLINRRAHAVMKAGLIPMIERLTERAIHLGKPDAIKLIFEASGFHNPKVKHEHSGDISISLNLPRPPQPKHVDAEAVVEEDVGSED